MIEPVVIVKQRKAAAAAQSYVDRLSDLEELAAVMHTWPIGYTTPKVAALLDRLFPPAP